MIVPDEIVGEDVVGDAVVADAVEKSQLVCFQEAEQGKDQVTTPWFERECGWKL